ncbi:lipoate--protein ligase family protein [Pasteuria penetrans]|uniref:lipoate--protein ligase family protein n=1 Tax=Pasteuria penetrans TaxID=86005 RepID=UPI0011ED6C12|nr:hypothetical protein [Pasteuria penetrans]
MEDERGRELISEPGGVDSPWRLLAYEIGDAAYHMAVDEALLGSMHSHHGPPTLRFYGWKRPTLSLGRFQDMVGGQRAGEVERNVLLGSVDMVRRPTGGRAVWHGEELTYSLVLSRYHPGLPTSVAGLTRFLATGLAVGLAKMGVWVDVSAARSTTMGGRAAACFSMIASGSLVIGGRKLGGNAQICSRGIVLQHGSLRLRHLRLTDHGRLGGVRKTHPWYRLAQQQMIASVPLSDLLSPLPCVSVLCSSLADGLSTLLGVKWHKGFLTSWERGMVARLQSSVYSSPTWTWNRRRYEPFPCGYERCWSGLSKV